MSEPTPASTPTPVPVPGPPVPGPRAPSAPAPPAPGPGAPGQTDAPDLGEHGTGDIVIDSALQDLRDAPADDLDAQIEAGRRVHQTLQGRLSHLGGE
ncbi:hypothetical protein ASD62_00020 [Phycicoccus sp. Root563]|uniref:hypothetical protein n=1 Tax=Phycicoccus sp. Root563 TaxID=1736562 RepID=UPI0007027294|nr:hypothetical protein [Phycicoccus sp. Root563]KQZ87948.1 hypothetical protein ASD62_00020 [Phycicoccus sp. Root563]